MAIGNLPSFYHSWTSSGGRRAQPREGKGPLALERFPVPVRSFLVVPMRYWGVSIDNSHRFLNPAPAPMLSVLNC